MTMPAEEAKAGEVGPSGWSAFVALSIFLLVLGGLAWMHPGMFGEDYRGTIAGLGPATLLLGVVPLVLAIAGWMRSDLRIEAADEHAAARKAVRQRTALLFFLLSEAMLFFAFFWAYIRFAAYPELAGSSTWPPLGIKVEDPFGMPLMATLILVVSGLFAVIGHHFFLAGRRGLAAAGLAVAIVLGAVFLGIQVNEFLNASFAWNAGSYASVFYFAVGFHGAHVFIGATLLTIAFFRLFGRTLTVARPFGLEAAVWYWHFVDGVWLLLFLVFYWWPARAAYPW